MADKDIIITEAEFDVGAQYQRLCKAAPSSGAVVFFVGLVRDLYQDDSAESIDYIELQHYAGMTETLCQQILEQAEQLYPFDAARIIHRVGKIYASEEIVMVAVASRHRQNAFQAAQFIMDYLKTRATFWKKEVGVRGEHWVGLKQRDIEAADAWSK
jgi:molybdopterin synthase catalytic subunit